MDTFQQLLILQIIDSNFYALNQYKDLIIKIPKNKQFYIDLFFKKVEYIISIKKSLIEKHNIDTKHIPNEENITDKFLLFQQAIKCDIKNLLFVLYQSELQYGYDKEYDGIDHSMGDIEAVIEILAKIKRNNENDIFLYNIE